MSKFNAGDRVKYYGAFNSTTEELPSTVTEVLENGILKLCADYTIDEDSLQIHYVPCSLYAHPNQCRRLKPKAKLREIWVNFHKVVGHHMHYTEADATYHANKLENKDEHVATVHYREVPKRKGSK